MSWSTSEKELLRHCVLCSAYKQQHKLYDNRGIAHGFCAHEDDSTLLYLVDPYSPTNVIGIS